MEITVSNTHELSNALVKINTTNEDASLFIKSGEYEILKGIEIKRNNLKIIGEKDVFLKGIKRWMHGVH